MTMRTKTMNRKSSDGSSDSHATAATESVRSDSAYFDTSRVPPYGDCLLTTVWKNDPIPTRLKYLQVVLTALGLTGLFFLPTIMIRVTDADASWDDEHRVSLFLQLMVQTLGLAPTHIYLIFGLTAILTIGMILADITIGTNSQIYPLSWKTQNTKCYTEMFMEPTRQHRLIRRPGNTLSNATYLFAAGCILASSLSNRDNSFWMADVLFGVMLLVLFISSVLWHGTNAPWTQYVDLWSMDSCILYLILRNACFGGQRILLKFLSDDSFQPIGGYACVFFYAWVILRLAKWQFSHFHKGYLHGGCSFSVRNRVMGTSDVWGQGHQDIDMSVICGYAALPVFYAALPTLVNLVLFRSTGSTLAVHWTFRTLVLGWTYRMWERWTLDGNWIVHQVDKRLPPSVLKTVVMAIVSPTAVLHALTGVTLLAGYMHSKSIDSLV